MKNTLRPVVRELKRAGAFLAEGVSAGMQGRSRLKWVIGGLMTLPFTGPAITGGCSGIKERDTQAALERERMADKTIAAVRELVPDRLWRMDIPRDLPTGYDRVVEQTLAEFVTEHPHLSVTAVKSSDQRDVVIKFHREDGVGDRKFYPEHQLIFTDRRE